MGQAKDASLRLKIIEEWKGGQKNYSELKRRHGVSYNTVRSLCQRYEAQGEAGLLPNYSNCGRRVGAEHEKSYRLVRLVKHLHPSWGVPYIVGRLKEKYPDLPLQTIRHYQRRLNLSSLKVPKAILPKEQTADRPRQPHDEWQIDAKERIPLKGGDQVCFLNITDSKTNALLKAKVFPLRPN